MTASDVPSVAMFVFNDAILDSRVRREAATLVAAGYRVTVVGMASEADLQAAETESLDGVQIIRLPVRSRWLPAWRLVAQPWALRRRSVGALRRGVTGGPSQWATIPSAVAGLGSAFALSTARGIALAIASARRRDRDLAWPPAGLNRLVYWRLMVLGWARDAGRAAPIADVYHGHDLPGLAAAVAAADRSGGLVLYDSHEIFLESGAYADLPGLVKHLIARQERGLARRAAALVTVNPAIGAELQRRLPVKRLVVVHNCPPRWTPPERPRRLLRTAAKIPPDASILLYHGVFTNHRGLEQLAEASLEPGLERSHVVYLGYGASRPEVDALVADPRFGGRLHVLDAVDPSVLLDWVAGADVGVIPGQPSTLNHWLSSPNKLFEALAAGVPVAIMDFPYVHQLVLDDPAGPLGTVCDPADPASIARAVREILERPEKARLALRARCLAAAHDRWNWETESARLVTLYAELLERASTTIKG